MLAHSYHFRIPHSNALGGRKRVPIFLVNGVFGGRSLGKISRENPGKGVFLVIAKGNQDDGERA